MSLSLSYHIKCPIIHPLQLLLGKTIPAASGLLSDRCRDPFDTYALHKAALLACGIVPLNRETTLKELLGKLGGGLYLSTAVMGIPRGSGLGTSSILAGACVKAIFEYIGKKVTENELYTHVLCMEQLMSTGGGWQDQVGGLTPGIKFITSRPGIRQQLSRIRDLPMQRL